MLLLLRGLKWKIGSIYRTLMALCCLSAMTLPITGCDAGVPRPTFTNGTTNSAVPLPAGSAGAGPTGSVTLDAGTLPTAGAVQPPSPNDAGPLNTNPGPGAVPRPGGVSSPSTDEKSVSGQRLPVGDLPGWRQVFASDFTHGDVPVGGFPGKVYGTKWAAGYGDGTPDTAGQDNGGKSGYFPSKVLSVKDGVLDWHLHSENGVSMGAAPAPAIANISPGTGYPNSQLYGRYSVRFKADPLPGFKTAWLLWPDSGLWPQDGEVDYPEGDLSGSFFGAVHRSGSSQDVFDMVPSDALFTSWHTATTEWTPGRVAFFLDGKPLGALTIGTPVKPMHYILQTESCLTECPLPATTGHIQVAWVAIWSRT